MKWAIPLVLLFASFVGEPDEAWGAPPIVLYTAELDAVQAGLLAREAIGTGDLQIVGPLADVTGAADGPAVVVGAVARVCREPDGARVIETLTEVRRRFLDNDCDLLVDSDDLDASIPGGMTFIEVPAGTFSMGCTPGQVNCNVPETPAHSVTLTHDFWLAETETTQGEWQQLMGYNPSWFGPNANGIDCGSNCPVERMDWFDALAFANAASAADGLPACYLLTNCLGAPGMGCAAGDSSCVGNGYFCANVTVNSLSGSVYDCAGYRLPTEAEWEYAARGGADTRYSGSNIIGNVAWYDQNSSFVTHEVATKLPNAWGFYDMSGNVWEQNWDWYDATYYSTGPATNPEGASSGSARVIRSGGCYLSADFSRLSYRNTFPPIDSHAFIGMRLARTMP